MDILVFNNQLIHVDNGSLLNWNNKCFQFIWDQLRTYKHCLETMQSRNSSEDIQIMKAKPKNKHRNEWRIGETKPRTHLPKQGDHQSNKNKIKPNSKYLQSPNGGPFDFAKNQGESLGCQ